MDGAITDYNKAIELKPDYVVAFGCRAIAKKAKGDLDGAIADYNKAIKLKPGSDIAYRNRSIAKDAKGDFDGAIADATHAIQLNPEDARAFSTRGGSRFSKGDIAGAIEDCKTTDKLIGKSFPQGVIEQGMLEFVNGNYQGAIDAWEKASELDASFERKMQPWIQRAKNHETQADRAGQP